MGDNSNVVAARSEGCLCFSRDEYILIVPGGTKTCR